MEEKFKSGFVSIIGRTNVGKSTIINALVGEKVAAVANKTQTTRTAIKAIINRPNSQIIIIGQKANILMEKGMEKVQNINLFHAKSQTIIVLHMLQQLVSDI